jgi:hypothetical protein
MSRWNGCGCTAQSGHRERNCLCRCHEELRHQAAIESAETRRTNRAKRAVHCVDKGRGAYIRWYRGRCYVSVYVSTARGSQRNLSRGHVREFDAWHEAAKRLGAHV